MPQDGAKSTVEEVWSVRRLLEWTTPFLSKKGVEKAWLDADLLLAHALGWKRIELRTRYEEAISEEARQRFRELVKRRAEGCPVGYLIGRKEFFSLDFEVTPEVLIPRADSEWLVTEGLKLMRGLAAPAVLDIGTGSGCLAVALAKQHKTARVTAIDISPTALVVAERNAKRHGVSERIAFLQGDLFTPIGEGTMFDLIVSNPPYIAEEEFGGLAREVRDFEPRLALHAGVDGLAVFDRLIASAGRYLKVGASLLIEIGYRQEAAARERVAKLAEFEIGKTLQDIEGRPRVICLRRR